MTNLEAVKILSNGVLNGKDDTLENNEAIELAISALENIDRITAERDKAIADLKTVILECHHECIPYINGWGWRGIKE